MITEFTKNGQGPMSEGTGVSQSKVQLKVRILSSVYKDYDYYHIHGFLIVSSVYDPEYKCIEIR